MKSYINRPNLYSVIGLDENASVDDVKIKVIEIFKESVNSKKNMDIELANAGEAYLRLGNYPCKQLYDYCEGIVDGYDPDIKSFFEDELAFHKKTYETSDKEFFDMVFDLLEKNPNCKNYDNICFGAKSVLDRYLPYDKENQINLEGITSKLEQNRNNLFSIKAIKRLPLSKKIEFNNEETISTVGKAKSKINSTKIIEAINASAAGISSVVIYSGLMATTSADEKSAAFALSLIYTTLIAHFATKKMQKAINERVKCKKIVENDDNYKLLMEREILGEGKQKVLKYNK